MPSSVVAIVFPNTTDAGRLKAKFERMEGRALLKLEDTAVIVRAEDGEVTYDTSAPQPGAGKGAAWGSLVGVLLGSIFLMPIAGLALGAATGALSGHLRKADVDAAFKQAVNDGLRPGTSALIVRVAQVDSEEVRERLAHFLSGEQIHGQVLHTNLSPEAEDALQAALEGQP
jgi:uncharacterized membrane protein